MAQLDYAMLAEFARADSAGLLTVVGGGFDRIQVNSLGLVHQVFLVARFRLGDDEDLVDFEVKVVPPNEPGFELRIAGSAGISPDARPIAGNFSTLSVIGLGLPIASVGRYSVQIHQEGELVRELPFEVDIAGQAAHGETMTVSRRLSLEIDQEAGAAYLQLSDDLVDRTVDFNGSIAVDLDKHGLVIGVEILDLTESVPLDELVERFHIHTEDLALLLQALRSSTTTWRVGSPVVKQSAGALRAQTVTMFVSA